MGLVNYKIRVGIKDFYNKYLPIAKLLIPSLKVLLTGKNPTEVIKRIQRSDDETLTIIVNPHDILSIVQHGRIYLCPICIGGGLKLRSKDGIKCGMSILVHEVSARGYNYLFNKLYFNERSFEQGISRA